MSNITETLANLSPLTVAIVMAVLFVLRYVLIKLGTASARSAAEMAESLAIAMGLVFLIIRPFFVQAFFIPTQSMEPTLLGHDQPTAIHDHILVNKTVYRMRDPRSGEVAVFVAPPEALQQTGNEVENLDQKTDYIKRTIGVPGDTIYVVAGYMVVDGQTRNHTDLRTALKPYAQELIEPAVKLTRDGVYVDGKHLTDSDLQSAFGPGSHKIEIHPGYVVRNGKRLEEPYTAEDPDVPYPIRDAYEISDGTTAGAAMLDAENKAKGEKKITLVQVNGHLATKLGNNEFLMMGDNRNHSWDSRFWGPVDRDRVVGRAMFIFFPLNRIRWVR